MFTSEAIEALDKAAALAHELRHAYENRQAVLDSHGPSTNLHADAIDFEARNVIASKLEVLIPLSKEDGRDPAQSVDYLRDQFMTEPHASAQGFTGEQIRLRVEEMEDDLFYLFDEAGYNLSAF